MSSCRCWGAALIALLALARPALGQSRPERLPAYYLELPTFDVNSLGRAGYAMPSAQPSLWVTANVHQLVNYHLGQWTGFYENHGASKVLAGSSIFLANLVLLVLPTGMAWEHEQWHHAALSMHDIDSHVTTNKVTGLSDQTLANLKRDHPVDFVRLHTAGVEGGYEVASTLEKAQFFHRTTSWNVPSLWVLYATNSFYLQTCASHLSDADGEDAAKQDDELERDIVGADCTASAYELTHRDVPYSKRGPHPTGIGLRRYRTYSDLSTGERSFVRLQRSLSLLNFLDPALLGFDALEWGKLRFFAHVRHLPTSFGHVLSVDGLFSANRVDWALSAQNFFNQSHWFPGLVAELWRYPVSVGLAQPLRLSARAGAWLQPKEQRYVTGRAQFGAMSAFRVGLGHRRFEPFVEVEAKSAGWVAGILTDEPLLSLRTGLGYCGL